MPPLRDSIHAQTLSAPPVTEDPAGESTASVGGFAALLAAPACGDASPDAEPANLASEALDVTLPGALHAMPAMTPPTSEPPLVGDAAVTTSCSGLAPGDCAAPGAAPPFAIPSAHVLDGLAHIFGLPGYAAQRRASPEPLQGERAEACRLPASDSDLLARICAIPVTSLDDLVPTLSINPPGSVPHDGDASLTNRQLVGAPQPGWDLPGGPSVGAARYDGESQSDPLPADKQRPRTAAASAPSLADLLLQGAAAEPTIPPTQIALPEKPADAARSARPGIEPRVGSEVPAILPLSLPEHRQGRPDDAALAPTVAGSTATESTPPTPNHPERLRTSALLEASNESSAIPEASPATLGSNADPTLQAVAPALREERRRFANSEKTVPREESRLPDPTVAASFTQTAPDYAATSTGADTTHADGPAEVRSLAQIPPAVPETVPPPAVASATSTSAGADTSERFGTTSASAPHANPVERMIAHQVARAVIKHVGDGDRSLVIRLTPPELGTVRIEFRLQEGRLCAHFQAEDPAVRQALERVLPQLTGDLRQADSPIQQLTVGSSTNADQAFDGRGFDGRGGQQANRQDQHGNTPRQRRGEHALFSLDGSNAPTASAPLPSTRVRVPAGLVDTLA